MSVLGQSRRFGRLPTTSGLPSETDIVTGRCLSVTPAVASRSMHCRNAGSDRPDDRPSVSRVLWRA